MSEERVKKVLSVILGGIGVFLVLSFPVLWKVFDSAGKITEYRLERSQFESDVIDDLARIELKLEQVANKKVVGNTANGWHRVQMRQWQEMFQKKNPDLDVPDLDSVGWYDPIEQAWKLGNEK